MRMRFGFLRVLLYFNFIILVNWESWRLQGWALAYLLDAVLESVMAFRLAAGAVVEVVVPEQVPLLESVMVFLYGSTTGIK